MSKEKTVYNLCNLFGLDPILDFKFIFSSSKRQLISCIALEEDIYFVKISHKKIFYKIRKITTTLYHKARDYLLSCKYRVETIFDNKCNEEDDEEPPGSSHLLFFYFI